MGRRIYIKWEYWRLNTGRNKNKEDSLCQNNRLNWALGGANFKIGEKEKQNKQRLDDNEMQRKKISTWSKRASLGCRSKNYKSRSLETCRNGDSRWLETG